MITGMTFAEVAIDSIVCGPNFAERLTTDAVRGLAQDIERNGLLQLPMIRLSDRKVVFGENRIAAHVLLERFTICVRTCECTDLEMEVMRRAENAFRRHDREEQARAARELVSLLEHQVIEERTVTPPPPKRGRPKSARAEARERAAGALGVTPDALRKADERMEEAEEPWQLDGWGNVVPDQVAADAVEMRAELESLASALRSALKVVRSMEGGAMPKARVERLKAPLVELHELANSYLPSHLCPVCRGDDGTMNTCGACSANGSVSSAEFALACSLKKMGAMDFSNEQDDMVHSAKYAAASFVEEDYTEEQEPPTDWEPELPPTADDINDALVYSNKEYQEDEDSNEPNDKPEDFC